MDLIIIILILLFLLYIMFTIRNYHCSCKEKYTNYGTVDMNNINTNSVYSENNTEALNRNNSDTIQCYDSEQVDAYKNTTRRHDIFVNNAFPKNSFDLRNNAQYDYGWTDNKSNREPKECIQDFRNVQFCAN